MMNPEKRRAFFEQLKANNPKPETELEYSSPFELLISVLLSAQATDVSVNKGTRKLFKIANTPQALLDLGEEGVRPYIQHIGTEEQKRYWLPKMVSGEAVGAIGMPVNTGLVPTNAVVAI
jgi:endonuclease-3